VLAQTFPNIEIVVVDDCSTDGTVDWLRSQRQYEGVVINVHPRNSGASVARNTGIEIANGEFIVFIDSDDLLLSSHVETAVATFQQYPALGLFCCDSKMIDPDGNVLLEGKSWHQNLSEVKGVEVKTGFRSLADVFAYSNCFPGFTLRREVFEKLGGFDQAIFPADDYDLALRVADSEYKVFYLHKPLCLRREHDGQCSGIVNSVRTQIELIKALRHAVDRDKGKLSNSREVANRIAEVKMELAISQIKDGKHGDGLRSMIESLAEGPKQIRTLAKIGGRKIRHALGQF
jgi:glycosyltransferase involved in cell wall biosynthesis